jgi:hypothetical protein
VRFLPPLFGVIGWAQLVKRFFKVNGDKDVESTVQHHRPPPLLGAQHTKLDAWLGWEA